MIKEKAYAKLNLDLHVGKLRNDGFHELRSTMIPINLYDTLTFRLNDKNVVLSNLEIKDNIIYKTILLFQNTFDIKENVKVKVKKKIPIGSGLGGGSADAAATLRGLNRLYNTNKTLKELELLANQLGSDVAFCLYNLAASVSGRGEIINHINTFECYKIHLFLLPTSLSTKKVYQSLTNPKENFNNYEQNLKRYKRHDFIDFIDKSENTLLTPALKISKEFRNIYQELNQIYSKILMTGSGSSLFWVEFKPKRATNRPKLVINRVKK